jgi:hypothetical protein
VTLSLLLLVKETVACGGLRGMLLPGASLCEVSAGGALAGKARSCGRSTCTSLCVGSAGPSAEPEALLVSERELERVFIVAEEQKREERELGSLRMSFLAEKKCG